MVEFITNVNSAVNGFVWGVPMLVLLVGTGILMTILTKFFQLSHLGHWFKNTVGGIFHDEHVTKHTEAGDQSISQFQSLCTALAATIGTGNIVGVASALVAGGPGAIFWMWVVAFFGMMTNYSENVLGIYYRRRNSKGEWSGGAMYYLKDGLGSYKGCKQIGAVLAVLFSAFCLLASFGIGNMSQINSIAGNMNAAFHLPYLATGLALMVVTALIVIGGLKRVAAVTEKLVPIMALFYIIGCVIILVMNASAIPNAFVQIFTLAFQPQAIAGGVAGVTVQQAMRYGVARGLFSNEAGLGSAAIAHAAADTKSPVQQGLYGIFEVFADTIVICTLTALTIICSGVDITFGHKVGSELITAAFATMFGQKFASVFVALALMLFAFTTILGWSLYGSRCVQYLFGLKVSKAYQVVFIIVVVIGAVASLDVVWDIADTFNGLMAIPNFIALFALSGVVAKLTKEYFFDKNKLTK